MSNADSHIKISGVIGRDGATNNFDFHYFLLPPILPQIAKNDY